MTRKARKMFDALSSWRAAGPIKVFRRRRKFTVAKLAKEVGCSPSNITYWEEHGGMPKKHLVKLAEAMRLHPMTLRGKILAWKKEMPT